MSIQQLNIGHLAAELEQMLIATVQETMQLVPISKTAFKYKSYLVKQGKQGDWNVYILTSKNKRLIASTFFKLTAFAICQYSELQNQTVIKQLLSEDEKFKKFYIDSLIFRNTATTTKSFQRRETALARLEVAHTTATYSKKLIEQWFRMSFNKKGA